MHSLPFLDVPIADRGVMIRDAAERDIPEILLAHEDDPGLFARIGLERPPSAAELGRELEAGLAEHQSGIGLQLTILELGSDDFRGRILVHNVDWENAWAELGIWVVPQARGRGLARTALRLTARWLFRSCGFQRLQLLTAPDNEPMLHAARAAGFVLEGVLRSYVRERGGRFDRAVLSLLPADLQGPG